MAKQGRAGVALAICAIASFVAGIIATVGLLFMAKPLAEVALKFGPADQFSLMILGLCALSSLAGKSQVKAFIMTILGLILSTVGVDPISGVARMTFGYPELYSGIEFLTLAVGMFALGEVFKTIITRDYAKGEPIKVGSIIPSKQDMKDSWASILRGSFAGIFSGAHPRLRRHALLVHGLYHGEEVQQEQGEFRERSHSRRCRARGRQQRRCRRSHDPAVDVWGFPARAPLPF